MDLHALEVFEVVLLAVGLLATALTLAWSAILWGRAFTAVASVLANAAEASEIVRNASVAQRESDTLPLPDKQYDRGIEPLDMDGALAQAKEAILRRRGSQAPTTDDYAMQDENAPLGGVGGTRLER